MRSREIILSYKTTGAALTFRGQDLVLPERFAAALIWLGALPVFGFDGDYAFRLLKVGEGLLTKCSRLSRTPSQP